MPSWIWTKEETKGIVFCHNRLCTVQPFSRCIRNFVYSDVNGEKMSPIDGLASSTIVTFLLFTTLKMT